ncbi:unnamed protein product [Phaedon cochleariae]|uniref:Uncharacterized protein n=1 Tax=Phaedon cochleariae TaxID=80249 RepID=A0A9N9SKE1_PHACE|nr:unnamed protein product [Phaedon cochleariae]
MKDTDRNSPASPRRSRSKSSHTSVSRSHSRSSMSRSRSRSQSSELDGYRLHIADIGDEVRRSDLEKIFAPFGELKEVWMTNSIPCFGFAVFKEKKAAAEALTATDGIEINGCKIRVSYARPRTRGSGRRFYTTKMRCYQCGYSGHFYRDCPESNSRPEKRERDRDTDRFGRQRRERDRDRESRRYRSSRSGRHDERRARHSEGGGSSSRRRR